jgi:hypothetical protein
MIALILVCLCVCSSLASAADLPERFIGAWEDVTVAKDNIDAGAWSCKFDSIKAGEGGVLPVVIPMTCDMRRGKSWRTQEVWSVQRIGGQEVLITASSKSIIVYQRR